MMGVLNDFLVLNSNHWLFMAAWNILYRAAGKVVLRWSGQEGNKPTSFMLRAIYKSRQEREKYAVYLSV